MLASVRNLDEGLTALRLGADLIDLKEPSRGALGALDHAAVRVMVQAVAGRRPVSATVGDQPEMEPQAMVAAVEQMTATGVNYIKIGIFAHQNALTCIRALADLSRTNRLIAVVMADEPWTFGSASPDAAPHLDPMRLLITASESGFAGAMLDTGKKDGRTLRDWRGPGELAQFVSAAKDLGLLTGLAGSLNANDIAPLLALAPDYLGFRGALCRRGARTELLDADAVSRVREAIPMEPGVVSFPGAASVGARTLISEEELP
jgi:dihydroneopterin aldolase